MRVIVNADDLGASAAVNEAIFRALERGVVSSATILANGPATADAAARLIRFPRCSFGVHLNVTEFGPVARGSYAALAAILDERQCFRNHGIREVSITLPVLRAVYEEWCEQIEVLARLGLEASHLDAHHHVHTLPQMLPVLAALRRRYKINKVRISRNLYEPALAPGRLVASKKRLYNAALHGIGFKTTRRFTDLETFVRVCPADAPNTDVVELMTHPGADQASEESRLLERDWRRAIPCAVNVMSYHDL